jgi:iron(III) transport system ATP-binding protein
VTEQRDALEVRALAKSFVDHRKERVAAIDGIDFTVPEGSFYTLLGPSGCGKTTTLRCVAGLERPDAGEITVAGVTVSRPGSFVPPHKRDIGMVFQSYAIWPHMTVFENVAFPLRVARVKTSRVELTRAVEEALATVALGGLEGRMSTELSGGQQQRLALARALVRKPKLLLLDEPLSNLDAKLRERMRIEVRDLQRRVGVTTLYVTHDQAEALSMSNRIAVMDAGRIIQEGNPREIYQQPLSSFVAGFVGASNFIPAEVVEAGRGGRLATALGPDVVHAACPDGVPIGEQVTIAIRPENVQLLDAPSAPAPGTANTFPGTVEQTVFLGDTREAHIRVGGATVLTRHHPTRRFRRGDPVFVVLPPEHCSVLTDTHGVVSAPSDDDA